MSTTDEASPFPRLSELLTREGMSEAFQACWFDSSEPASDDAIAELLDLRPWLPTDYLQFLGLTNGCVLEMFVFYGLGADHPSPLAGKDFYVEPYGRDDWFVVGHDPSGDVFVLGLDGGVARIGSDPPPEAPEPLCSSFHDLIEHICCGPGYADYFGGDNASDWSRHIEALGWTSKAGP